MTIDPLLPVWLILLLLPGLLTWSVVLEWRRPLRFRLLRLFACALAALSLVVIFLQPSRLRTSDKQAILLTGSYSHIVVDSLLRTRSRDELYHLAETGHRNSHPLSSYRALFSGGAPTYGKHPTTEGAVGRIEAIVGDGLPKYALDSIPYGFLYFPSQLPDGFTGVSLPYLNPRRNHSATIAGTYLTSTIPATLYFSGPAGRLDSAKLSNVNGQFSFSFTPRASGRLSYSLTLIDSTGHHIEEKVPLNVDEYTPLKIFMLQDNPTFEMQYLKNFLSDRGHQIAVRAQLSRNTFRTEFSNRSPTSLDRLTPPLLASFDLLIVDPSVLSHLSPSERSSVASALQNGLGMIVVFNGVPEKFPDKLLLPISFSTAVIDTTSLLIQNKRIALPASPLKPTSFEGTAVTKDPSRVLSGYMPMREGMIGFQLLRETYSILLAGDSTAYGSIWSPLIDVTARSRQRTSTIRVVSEFPLSINEPVAIELISDTAPELFADNVQVPVGEDPIIDGLWHATVWPGDDGWHDLHTQTDTSSFYVFNPDDWKALRITQQQEANKMAASRSSVDYLPSQVATPVALLPFWIVFLISVGFLWLAPKL